MKTYEQIENALRQNGLYADDIELDGLIVKISIEWGDWKHEHLNCKRTMILLGLTYMSTEVTDEDGSDCYSATHYFIQKV